MTTKKNEMALIPIPETNDLEAVVKQCNLAALNEHGQFQKAFMMAAGIQRLRQMINPDMMKSIVALQGTSLGFKTDKDSNGGYDEKTVKDCMIEAVLRGVQPVGNQFNIIASRCYVTKEGFTHLLKNLPGLSKLNLKFGVPKTQQGGAIVEASANWIFNGQEDSYGPREFAIKTNKYMGADAILGKCERKLRKAIYEQITGVQMIDGDVSDIPVTTVTPESKQSNAADELNAQFAAEDTTPTID